MMITKKVSMAILALALLSTNLNAQLRGIKINSKTTDAVSKGAKALTFSNEDAAKLSKEGVDWMDTHNAVAGAKDPYTKRLERLFGKHKTNDGLKLIGIYA